MQSIYLIGSLRNPKIPKIGNALRKVGFDVFEDWWAAGKIADDCWRQYEKIRNHSYVEALKGYAARHVFEFDRFHVNRCDLAVLALPAGKSGHLELGVMLGQGKKGYILFDKEPRRWDVMYQFATGVYFNLQDLLDELERVKAVYENPNE